MLKLMHYLNPLLSPGQIHEVVYSCNISVSNSFTCLFFSIGTQFDFFELDVYCQKKYPWMITETYHIMISQSLWTIYNADVIIEEKADAEMKSWLSWLRKSDSR